MALSAWWAILHLSLDAKRRNFISYKISETMGQIDAAAMISETFVNKKFSFRNRLAKKGVLNT